MKKDFSLGFTLVELVLVISIVVVLSVISGPIYRSYAYKARQAEGYALIGTIRSAQENYFGEYGNFLSRGNSVTSSMGAKGPGTCNDEILGIDARPNKYYTSFNIGWTSGANPVAYAFTASAFGSEGAADVVMMYNRTSGITMATGSGTNVKCND